MEELLARHRAERKDLQSKITSKKKNATKKTRKGVNDECENLERELKERQQAEMNEVEGTSLADDTSALDLNGSQDPEEASDGGTKAAKHDQLEKPPKQVSFDSNTKSDPSSTLAEQALPPETKKPSRQKARLARRAAEQAALASEAAEEAANLPDQRAQELAAMRGQQSKLGLLETFIQPDGHCLYSAIAHGLPPATSATAESKKEGYHDVRVKTSKFIEEHSDDFAAFLEEPLVVYVRKIRDTAEWGGQVELQAIARAYEITVKVLQADGRVETFESGTGGGADSAAEVWLAYYKHSFGLGEHYNALKKA
ncbi:OTU domain-containing protein 2 [Cyphellophora attinorum]|uniref:OTU domain-containing protein 2 n=1 Tax=Cyphellophora attinorum TaxID=1664694 RepID=A0A0N1P188_9EURO|nr:OTU domain-containing protein 2 [Phialophora attinorum]KPI40312.1 OTU domain-containing protein 2 [Phialophora attinorum]